VKLEAPKTATKNLHRDDLAGEAVDDLGGPAGEVNNSFSPARWAWRIVGFNVRPSRDKDRRNHE